MSFLYNDPKAPGAADGRVTGLIAQEVEKVFPDWVSTVDGTYKAVAPRGFEALTVEALRELRAEKDAEIQALREDNRALRQEMAEMRAMLDRLLNEREAKP